MVPLQNAELSFPLLPQLSRIGTTTGLRAAVDLTTLQKRADEVGFRVMTLPMFGAADDPGPSFVEVLRRRGHAGLDRLVAGAGAGPVPEMAHGTTIVAVRYADGVLMAGDRRATAGGLIAQRSVEKIFPADRHSGVAIAGALGPALEMVKLFQLQLEHYEKVENTELSLEGKANQLGQMVRDHLPAARQGLAVVPLFAGYDTRRGTGRLFEYDVTGGRYEERDIAATGSGSLHAGMAVKVGFRPGLDLTAVADLVVAALFEAADEDSATGGPDPVRGIYPLLATITASGFTYLDEALVAERFGAVVERLTRPHRTTGR
jgi:proteasome beta subunit